MTLTLLQPSEKNNNEGCPLKEGVEGGVSLDPGGSGSFQQATSVQGMCQ